MLSMPDHTLIRRCAVAAACLSMLHVLGTVTPTTLWGTHSYAFLPTPSFVAAIVTVALLSAWALRSPSFDTVTSRLLRSQTVLPLSHLLIVALLTCTVLWLIRVHHLLHGDALPLVATVVARTTATHPYEPLAMWLQHVTARLLLPANAPWSFEDTWRALAVGNIIVGGGFVCVAWMLALEVVRATGTVARRTPQELSLALLSWVLLLSQGYMLLFCGYIENYALFALFLSLYLASGLRALRRASIGFVPAFAFFAAVASHLSGLVLLPSLLFLYALGHTRSRVGMLSVASALVAGVFLARVLFGYDLLAIVRASVPSIFRDTGASMIAWTHWRDVINALLLACPVLVLGGMLLGGRATALGSGQPEQLFLMTTLAPFLAFVAVLGDSNIGFARNWDLIAPVGIPLTALVVLWCSSLHGHAAPRVLFVAVVLSLFHTIPWMLVNASEETAVRRFATLPLGGGRVASTLGYWHLLRGREQEAEPWLAQAVRENPANVRAHYYRGRLYERQGRYRDAALAFQAAASLRPDIKEFRFRGAEVWRRQGQMRVAFLALGDTAGTDAATNALKALLLYGSGDIAGAASAARRATAAAPDIPAYKTLVGEISASVPYEELMERHWSKILSSGYGTGVPR